MTLGSGFTKHHDRSRGRLEAAEVDDTDLAIELPACQAVADEKPETPSSSQAGDAVPAQWLGVIEDFVTSLDDAPAGDLSRALEALCSSLGLTGAAVVEQRPGEESVILASRGQVEELQESDEGAEDGPSADTPPCHRASLPRPTGERLHLLVWGRFTDPERARVLLRPLLRWVERSLRPDSADTDPQTKWQRSGPPPLVFPSSYVIASSAAMTDVYRQMASVAGSEVPVLISGETGVGKEWIARILHASSGRGDGPFVAVNCAAIPTDLAETELFGIEKGVATGVTSRPGKFRSAEGGTLFLDEIGDMEPALQVKLLRALEEHEVQPVGGQSQSIDVRILAATNADLEARIASGAFRRDLFFRLAGHVLDIPPLRACQADIASLVENFLRRANRDIHKEVRGVSYKAMRLLIAYPWPGNVRELRHEVRSLVHRCAAGQAIESALLPARLIEPIAIDAKHPAPLDFEARVRRLEREMIEHALSKAQGVRSRAAKLLGISRNRLARKRRQLGI